MSSAQQWHQFPWDTAEGHNLHAVLVRIADRRQEIVALYERCSTGLPPLREDAADVMWREALSNLAVAGLLGVLCDVLLARQLHPALRGVIEAFRASSAASPASDDHGPLVLDRTGLKTKVRRLAPPGGPLRAIVVRGGPDSGKSHGRHVFEQAARAARARVVYLNADMVATVEDAIAELFSVLHATGLVPPVGETTGHAYYRVVWRTLREIAENRGVALWIAVDDLGLDDQAAPLVDPQIREFFDYLILLLPNPSYGDRFRLMLIHYPDGRFPTKWLRDVFVEERTTAADVSAEHVAELLEARLSRHGRSTVRDEIEALAQEIVAEADKADEDGSGDSRLQRLHDLVEEAIESMVSGS